MRRYFPFFLLLFLASCKGPETIVPSILSVGHGGVGFDTYRNMMPPNTAAAVERGLVIEGAGGVEIDVQLTQDSVLVLHHDGSLDASTHCGGCIPQLSLQDLVNCPITPRNGPIAGNYPIPTLESILAQFNDGKAVFFLNVKTNFECEIADLAAFRARFARALSSIVEQYDLYARCYIETYDRDLLSACRREDPAMRIVYDEDNFDLALERALANGYEGIGIVNENVDADQVAKAKAAGLYVVIWGVRVLAGTQAAIEKAPDAIMTDDIRMLNNLLKQ